MRFAEKLILIEQIGRKQGFVRCNKEDGTHSSTISRAKVQRNLWKLSSRGVFLPYKKRYKEEKHVSFCIFKDKYVV